MKLRVTSIQRGCVNDGPGVRTVVFLKGCMYKCPWCCNPETQSFEEEIFFDKSRCLLSKGVNSTLCDGCKLKTGNRDILKCPFKAAVPVSKDYTKDELIAELLRDNSLYEISNGGVTFSGGEPLLHAKQLLALLIALKNKGINTAIETTLVIDSSVIRGLMHYVDCWYVDLKLQPEMEKAFQQSYSTLCDNILILKKEKTKIIYRLVVTNSVFEARDTIVSKLKSFNIKEIELLKCHNLANTKYGKLNVQNKNFTTSKSICINFANYLNMMGVNNIIMLD